MRFRLTQNKFWMGDEEKEKLEKLGFKFKEELNEDYRKRNEKWKCDNNVEPVIGISSLEDLMKLVKDYGVIVLSENGIEIYNDYRE